MYRPPLIGFFVGLICSGLWFASWFIPFGYDDLWDTWVMHFLVWVSTPIAHIVSAIKGWPLQQEAAMYIYGFFAIPITFPLLGLLIGFIYTGVRVIINRKSVEDQ